MKIELTAQCVAPPRWARRLLSQKIVVARVVVRPRASRSSSRRHCSESPGSTWHARGRLMVLRQQLNSEFLINRNWCIIVYLSSSSLVCRILSFILSLLLRQQRAVDVAASLKRTVEASAERSRASFEIGHGHSGTWFPASKPRVGGTVGDSLRDGSDGWRSKFPGATRLGASFSTSSADHPLSAQPTGSELRDASWTVYDDSSSTSRRVRRWASLPKRCRGSRKFRPCRCCDFGLVLWRKPANHRLLDVSATPDIEASSIMCYHDPYVGTAVYRGPSLTTFSVPIR